MSNINLSDLELMMVAQAIDILLDFDYFYKYENFPTSYQTTMMRRITMRSILLKLSKKTHLSSVEQMIKESLTNYPEITPEMFLIDCENLKAKSE
ncbi:hypothetical protein H1P_3610011 [Hyella patelloides LEGE 07179]|uniref:Uncharacterized protein n=1 Tax=Hyella patelloides LEGE 07179 TaxID=945734 RepID=A0A563VWE9_9CYAN|nr:hypothetical protein [Hyella patelloides]VEP15717.1 hypothetical protein H1P_3610011 [Hyella patelloides LEGE 07179]